MKVIYAIIVILLFTDANPVIADVRLYLNSEADMKIEVEDNYMRIYSQECNDMLVPATICTLKPLRCGYSLINSIKTQMAQNESPTIIVDSVLTSCDSIFIKFDMTRFSKAYSMIITYKYWNITKFDVTGNFCVKLGRNVNSTNTDVKFILAPSIYNAYLPNGAYGGIGSYKGSISSKYWGKSISVSLDFIDADYFSRICIDGDYIKMTEDEIQWRGIIFKRINCSENL